MVSSFCFDTLKKMQLLQTVTIRVTSLEQLSVAEFNCEQARPKVYRNGHKNILAIWLDLVLDIKIWVQFYNFIFLIENFLKKDSADF